MKHLINPTIDCVFKAILGAVENTDLLCHFLNSILQPTSPIVSVNINNPYNEKLYLDDKLSIVDIKATDNNGEIYQIEVQMSTPGYLKQRMLNGWSSIYRGQLTEGKDYRLLKPVTSIWLLTKDIIQTPACHHHFEVFDRINDIVFSDDFALHIFELEKWQRPKQPNSLQAQDYWLYFFKEGKNWKKLPVELNIPPMRQAMKVLERFSEQEKAYHIYESRLDAIRDQWTRDAEYEERRIAYEEGRIEYEKGKIEYEKGKIAKELAQAKAEAAQIKLEKVQAAAEVAAKAAIQEQQRLKDLLREAGVDPDAS